MKLQRNVYKVPNLYGAIPPNTSLDGDILWQPERIRAMWERKDVYGVLGLPREATTQQIKRQYRKLVLKLHPDKGDRRELWHVRRLVGDVGSIQGRPRRCVRGGHAGVQAALGRDHDHQQQLLEVVVAKGIPPTPKCT
ncbi:hypothetical protein PINS_up022993 [Pythium insidiosum]|nr:hypothetical protein PINS_up022993 [Pythium insidiosum]